MAGSLSGGDSESLPNGFRSPQSCGIKPSECGSLPAKCPRAKKAPPGINRRNKRLLRCFSFPLPGLWCNFEIVPRRSKVLTREQLQSRKEKAVRFLRDVKGEPDRADEVDDESLDSYAERRKIQLSNPTARRGSKMAQKSVEDYRDQVKELKQQIRDLEDQNQALNDKLDSVADALESDAEDDGEDASDDSDDDDRD
jgi:DNA-binding ferritin-like protein